MTDTAASLDALQFNSRKVRMSVFIKSAASGVLSTASFSGLDQAVATMANNLDLYADVIEGGYIHPDGRPSERGIKAAIGAYGEAQVQQWLDQIPDARKHLSA